MARRIDGLYMGVTYNAMAFHPTENGVRLVLQWVSGGLIRATNHFWYRGAEFTEEALTELATSFFAGWNANNGIKDVVPTTIRWTCRVVDERSYDGLVVNYDPQNIDGEAVGNIDAWSLAMGLTLYTAKRGRAYRGRLYFPGFADDTLIGGVYTQATADALMISLDAVYAAIGQAGFTWCVRTSQKDKVSVNPATLTNIQSYVVRSLIPVNQRRRSLRP